MRQLKSITYLSLSLLVFGACSDGPTGTNSGDPLEEAEVQALLIALAEAYGGVNTVGAAAPMVSGAPSPAFSAVPIDASFNETVPCNEGNMVIRGSMNGDIDDQTFLGSFDIDIEFDPSACRITSGTSSFTVDGDPHIQLTATFTIGETTFSVEGSETGGIAFTTADGRTGTCAIDLDFSSSINSETQAISSTVSGTVCGLNATAFETGF